MPEAIRLTLDAQPSPDWTIVNVPGWKNQQGFRLRVPPGWLVKQTQGIDSYVGEVFGDSIRLKFDYGLHSWSLNPADDPEHEYVVLHEDIGDVERKLLIPVGNSAGFTGVYFAELDGPNRLNVIGKDLTPEQQHTAIAIFRSIRSGIADDGESIVELGAPNPTPSGPPVRLTVGYEGMQYLRVAGPVREELVDLDRLTPAGLVLDESGITHIKLPGSKQRTILDESHRSITHGCRQPSHRAYKTICRRGELAFDGQRRWLSPRLHSLQTPPGTHLALGCLSSPVMTSRIIATLVLDGARRYAPTLAGIPPGTLPPQQAETPTSWHAAPDVHPS